MNSRRFTLAIFLTLSLSTVAGLAQAQQTITGYVTRVRGLAQAVSGPQQQALGVGSALALGSKVVTQAKREIKAEGIPLKVGVIAKALKVRPSELLRGY